MTDLVGRLPHRPPIRLVETVLDADDRSAVCLASISPQAPTADLEGASSVLALEMAAQATALVGARAQAGDRPDGEAELGFLVRIRDARLHQARLPVGEPLRITVTRSGGAGPLAVFDVSVVADSEPERLLAEGRLSTMRRTLEERQR